ncbi:MAG: AIPR family protein [Synergistaceae bacterium]|nr:AIPR family protein [Synergistaceae bacterium]
MSVYDNIKHDIAQEYYINNYSNDGQRFIAWYLRNIHNLDPIEAKACITDGAGDKQIDAVYVNNEDETVYIIQGKFTQKAKLDAKPLMEIQSSWIQIKNLPTLQENANEKLAYKVSEISSALDDGYDIHFELILTSELTEAALKDVTLFSQELADCENIDASLEIVDIQSLERKYNDALNVAGTGITYDFSLEPERFMQVEVNGKKAVIAVISIQDCIYIPGIKDGSLFRKNVRQSLGKSVKVNKEIATSLKKNPGDFFFLHNGITAICSSIDIHDNIMTVKNLSVVNGCQSLTTIYNNSEAVSKSEEGYIIFRIYEIADGELIDTISTSTNSQNGVKPRDLRSNDKYVLTMKKSFEQCYPDGSLITKRGEKPQDGSNNLHVVELSTLGKMLVSWHVQRPMETHLESEIFSSHFNLLFHRKYPPENIQALNEIYTAVFEKWSPKSNNPLNLNEALVKLKSYAAYWHFFAVSLILCEINNAKLDTIPSPYTALKLMKDGGIFDDVISLAGYCTNDAFRDSMLTEQMEGKTFNPSNWAKSKKSIIFLRSVVGKRLSPSSPEERKYIDSLREKLKMSEKDFEPKWTAD